MKITKHTPFYVAFSHIPGVGSILVGKLIQAFGDIEKAYAAPEEKLAQILGAKKAKEIVKFRSHSTPHSTLQKLLNLNVQFVDFDALSGSELFRTIWPIPLCLYAKGDLSLLFPKAPRLAIIGTRKPTAYGITQAELFSYKLVKAGYIIVSGLAFGIDSVAHRTALSVFGSKTIAVLGSGINQITPQAHESLAREILEKGGLILSEFPPDMSAQPGHFVIRNRLISGLSDGVLVVEGSAHSGTLITAKYAAEQGKEVFCIPGRLDSPHSIAPHILIQNGAHLVTKPEEILSMLQ